MDSEIRPEVAYLEMQAELPVIPKSRDGYKFKYAPYEKIGELAFPVMWKHGFTIFHSATKDANGQPVVRTTLTHAASGAKWESEYEYDPKQHDQERGKSLTYGKRYNTALLLGLRIEGEPDRDGESAAISNF